MKGGEIRTHRGFSRAKRKIESCTRGEAKQTQNVISHVYYIHLGLECLLCIMSRDKSCPVYNWYTRKCCGKNRDKTLAILERTEL